MTDKNPMMTLEEFKQLLINDVDKFIEEYRKGKEQNPDYFPERMPPGEWYEQFQIHQSST